MSLAETAIKRPIFITCIVVLTLIMGVVSLNKMSVDLFPDVTFPAIFVRTVYPGASPIDMEKLVSKIIEDELGSLPALNKISSQNMESLSLVILQFRIGSDIKDLEQQVRQRLGNIRRKLPGEIDEPIVKRFDPADQPIVRLAVASEIESGKLFDIADEVIKGQFETLPGVGQVSITGGRKREIQVLVDKKKLQDRNLSLLQVSEKIKNTSKDVPVGKIENNRTETVLRASGEFESVDALRKVNVSFFGSDTSVALSEIAKVEEGLEDETTISSVMNRENNFEREKSLFIDVYKQSGANTVKIVDQVVAKIEKTNKLLEERGIKASVSVVRDGARPIRLNITDVRESIFIGILLCVIVVFFFLGSGRSTFITGMALPNSLLGGFIIMYAMGFTINILTLLALSLAVGLLIDDAIVVRENIFRHLEMGKSPIQAAIDGTKEVTQAVIATTLVVIAVFGPIAFLEGIVGQFFRQFGLTVVFTMLISLFDALTVAPMMSAFLATSNDHKRGTGPIAKILNKFDELQTKLENFYEKVLNWTIKHRLKTLGFALAIFIGSLSLFKFLPKTFLPHGDNAEFNVVVEKPVGSSLTATKGFVQLLEDVIKTNPSIQTIATVVGQDAGSLQSPAKATMYVRLVPKKERKATTTQVKEQVREALKKFKEGGTISITDVDVGGGGQKVFNLNVRGDNLDELSVYVEKLKARLQKITGLADVDTNYRTGKPEFHVVFDRERSENLGVSTVTAGAELRARVEGIVSSTYREEGREYDIRVKLNEAGKDLRTEFASTTVPNVNYNMIPLNRVAEGKEVLGYSQINRQNKSRYINIDANLSAKGSLGDITTEVESVFKNELPPPAGVSYQFEGQAEDFKELMQNMLIAMFLGIIFIYLVLSSLYESFITPFSILLALPLAISGAIIALLVTGSSLNLFAMIGFILLLGVVAKNSILLVDYAHQMMDKGVERSEALIMAGKTRLRPILMTSLALIAGTIPIAIGLNEASAMRTAMGIAIIGGLISSTILTLLVVPSAFGYIDDFRKKVNKWVAKARGLDHQIDSKPPLRQTDGNGSKALENHPS